MFTYAGDFGHFPPGWDPTYTQDGYGPPKMSWQGSRDRYPDNRGKTHTLFCDGSVRLMAPEDWTLNNVALGY